MSPACSPSLERAAAFSLLTHHITQSLGWATLSSGNKRLQFHPEPSANPAVEEEVEGRVEDEEDVVEMRDADQVGRDAVTTKPE